MRKHFITPLLVAVAILCLPCLAMAQENDVQNATQDVEKEATAVKKKRPISVDLSAAFKTKHIWNGLVSYDAWNLQPNFNFSAYGFFINAWACIPYSQIENSEIDLGIGYSWGPLTVTYTEIYYACPTAEKRVRPHFFRFAPEDEGAIHQHYATFHFDGVKYFPIQVDFGIFTFGDIAREAKAPGDTVYREQYSMYLGLGYTHTLKTGQTLSYHIGGSPYKGFFTPDKGNIVNIKFSFTQPVKITDHYTIPITADFILNPCWQKFYFVLGIGLF